MKNSSMCSYNCFICNGAEYRCGKNNDNCPCGGNGGKYCWEENVVLVLKKDKSKKKIEGTYDGYRRMSINKKYINQPKKNWDWAEFELKPYMKECYCPKNRSSYSTLCINIVPQNGGLLLNPGVYIYCKSCYDKI